MPKKAKTVWEQITYDPDRKAKDARSWQEWKEDLWWSMAYNFRAYPGLAPLEQYMIRSAKEKRCVECGAPGVVRQGKSKLIPSVDHHWMCCACANYWACRADADRGPLTLGQVYTGYPEHIEVEA